MKKSLAFYSILALSSFVSISAMAQGTGGSQPSFVPGGAGGPFGGGAGGGQFSEERRQRMLEKFDTNHDGKLDDNERAQMHAFMQQRRMERMQAGASGNPIGSIAGNTNGASPGNTSGNFGAGAGSGGPGGKLPSFEERRQKMLQMFDANHDGELDANEKAQMQAFMQKRRMERQQQGGFGFGQSNASQNAPSSNK